MKTKSIYSDIFEFYELKQATILEKQKMRKLIQRYLEKEYGDKKWEDLTDLEQKQFIYITLRRPMIRNYIENPRIKYIEEKIDKVLRNTMMFERSQVQQYNKNIERMFNNYYDNRMTDEEKEEAYNRFMCDCKLIASDFPTPPFEEWVKHPLRPCDILTSKMYESANSSDEEFVSQSEIDHVILKTILKILERKLNIKIDVSLINECLLFLNNFNDDIFEELQIDYDPKLKLSKEEQEKIIQRNITYVRYKNMLDTLRFWEEE